MSLVCNPLKRDVRLSGALFSEEEEELNINMIREASLEPSPEPPTLEKESFSVSNRNMARLKRRGQ